MAELEQEAKEKLALLAALLVVCLGFVLLALSIAGQDVIMLTALVALVGFVVVLPFPKLAIIIVILFAQVQYLFTGYYGSLINHPVLPVAFQWLDEVVLLALLGNLVLTKLLKRQPIEKAPALIPLTLMFMLGVISARLNDVRILTGFIGQRYVFEMVILYLAIINLDLGEQFLRSLVYFLLGIGVFQAVMGIAEFVDKHQLYMAGNHDIVQGTWGGGSANSIGIFFLCLSTIVLASLRWGWKGPKAALLGIYILMLVLTSCRTGIVLALPIFLFVLREKVKNPKYWVATASAIVFMVACLAFYYRNTEAEAVRDLGSSEFAFQVSQRTRVIPIMSQILWTNSVFPAIGAGPGTYMTATGIFYGSKMYMQIESMLRTEEVIEPFITASYAVVWMEYGTVGLALFGVVLVRLFLFAWHQEKVIKSLFWRDYFRGLQAIIVIYAFVGGIFALWTHFQSNVYLWLFTAIGARYVVLQRRKVVRPAEAVVRGEEKIPPLLPKPHRLGSMAVNR